MKNFSRRDFIKASSMGLGTAILTTGITGCFEGGNKDIEVSFLHGVASGDPLSDRVILWTRVTTDKQEDVSVSWHVYEADSDVKVAEGAKLVSARSDYTLKIDVAGLNPGTRYRYNFTSNEVDSPTGYARTLPTGHIESTKFAVVSCSNYPAGFFNVYKEIAELTDIDAVLHLGDYIYEYGMGEYATERAEEIGRALASDNQNELFNLDDYRKRYALYHSDTNLQMCHQNHTFITVWDDHEVANDSYQSGAENHQEDEGDYDMRKLQALQAYFEWIPIRDNGLAINRTLQYGDLLDLIMLDTRIQGRDKQIAIEDFFDSEGNIDGVGFQAALADPTRSVVGNTQFYWMLGQLTGSSTTWQVLGQQILMGRMLVPAAIATRALSIDNFVLIGTVAQIASIYQRYLASDPTLTAEELAMLTPENLALMEANQALLTPENLALIQLPSIPYNLDAWDGYAYEREAILTYCQVYGKNLVVLAGDTHNAWANDIKLLDGSQIGVEFATSSITSPGMEEYLSIPNRETSIQYEAGITQLVTDLQFCNLYDRGYMTVNFTHEEATADWFFVDTVLSDDYQVLAERTKSMKVLPGSGNRKLVPVE